MKKTIEIKKMCRACGGWGVWQKSNESREHIPCPSCKGIGTIKQEEQNPTYTEMLKKVYPYCKINY